MVTVGDHLGGVLRLPAHFGQQLGVAVQHRAQGGAKRHDHQQLQAAAGTLARRGVLVRKLEAFEALAAVDTLVFDKTGTLTRDAMVLASIKQREGVSADRALAIAAALAQYSLHPVSKALLAASKASENSKLWYARDAVEVAGGGISGLVWCEDPLSNLKDAAMRVCLGSADFCSVAATRSPTVQAYLSDEQGWLATFELSEDVRTDAQETIKTLLRTGIAVHLLSGDSVDAAGRVAKQVGITEFRGGCAPQDKLDFLRQAQQSGHKVGVVGDGLNFGGGACVICIWTSCPFGASTG